MTDLIHTLVKMMMMRMILLLMMRNVLNMKVATLKMKSQEKSKTEEAKEGGEDDNKGKIKSYQVVLAVIVLMTEWYHLVNQQNCMCLNQKVVQNQVIWSSTSL